VAADGYEKNYETLRPRLAQADFGARAEALGFRPAEGGASIGFLGREYLLDPQGVRAADGLPSPANHRSLLIHYLLSPGQGGPGERFLTLWQFPGFVRGRREPGSDLLSRPALAAFGDDAEGFRRAALALGGEELPPTADGWLEWLFKALPRVSAKVGYLPADEEFPAEVRVYFDDLAPSYLEFECLAFLCGSISQALAEAKGAAPPRVAP
jgi:hypothetical protein